MRLASVTNECDLPPAPEIKIVPTTPDHVRYLEGTMREADRNEIMATGISPMKGLWRSYKNSIQTNTVLVDGKAAAIFGYSGALLGETGGPWVLTGKELDRIPPVVFVRMYRDQVHRLLKMFPKLIAYVWADHEKAIRLIEICGFTLCGSQNIGNHVFHKYMRVA